MRSLSFFTYPLFIPLRITLRPRCADNCGWGSFSTFPRWRSRVFWCASFGKYELKPFQISFFGGFYIKIMFWVRWFHSLFEQMRLKRKPMFIHTNQRLITSLYIKSYLFCRISDDSALIRNFLRNWRVRGVNRSGAWGLILKFTKRYTNKIVFILNFSM